MPFKRNTQEELIAMKKEIIDKCIAKEMLCKDGAKLLHLHPKSFSRLKSKYQREGEQALVPKKTGPKNFIPQNRTSEIIEQLVVCVASENKSLGPVPLSEKLLDDYQVTINQSTVWRILKRKGERYFRDYQPVERKPPKLYCLDIPGEELQLDGSYPFGRSRKIVAFSAIDDCSRFVWGKCYTGETADNAIRFVKELIPNVPFQIRRIRVDNRYGKKFKQYCELILGIEVIQNDPYSPKQNGKIERFHGTLKKNFFWRYCSFYDPLETLNYKYWQWLKYYNYERRHGGYGMDRQTPAQKISSTLFLTTTLILNNYPQKVTGILQQYIT